MPPDEGESKSEFAGKEPEHELKKVMMTTEGKKVVIVDYVKNLGLYVVSNVDDGESRSPLYRISPDKLKEI